MIFFLFALFKWLVLAWVWTLRSPWSNYSHKQQHGIFKIKNRGIISMVEKFQYWLGNSLFVLKMHSYFLEIEYIKNIVFIVFSPYIRKLEYKLYPVSDESTWLKVLCRLHGHFLPHFLHCSEHWSLKNHILLILLFKLSFSYFKYICSLNNSSSIKCFALLYV